jgi:hypothetical protein
MAPQALCLQAKSVAKEKREKRIELGFDEKTVESKGDPVEVRAVQAQKNIEGIGSDQKSGKIDLNDPKKRESAQRVDQRQSPRRCDRTDRGGVCYRSSSSKKA